MKAITVDLVMAYMEPSDWEAVGGCVLDAAGLDTVPPRSLLEQVLLRLWSRTLGQAMCWGFGDSSVADMVYDDVREGVEKFGTLDAWLAAVAANPEGV